jgi:hypothetical protein
MSYQEYLNEYFDGVASDMAKFWDKLDQEVQRWKDLKFYVIEGNHIKVSEKNIRKVKK